MSHFKDLSGQTFGRLLVLQRDLSSRTPTKFFCRCVCGTEVSVLSPSLIQRKTESCGCLGKERRRASLATHGASHTPTFRSWAGMIARCTCPTNSAYKDYGGRGITVCERWKESFSHFLTDMGERPSTQYSLDRYPDNNGPYSPQNCRWATQTQQARNTRKNMLLTYQGITRPLTEWAEIVGIASTTIRRRIEKHGWSLEKALTVTPSYKYNRRDSVLLTWNGETRCIPEWSEILHIPVSTLRVRYQTYHWTVEKTLSTPAQRR